MRPRAWARRSTRRSGSPRPGTAARSSSTSAWRRCSARRLREPGQADGGQAAGRRAGDQPDPAAVTAIARLLAQARRPVLVLGSDVWLDGAHEAARRAAEELRLPVIANGQGRGILPAGHDLLVSRARPVALGEADLVIVAGTPLDFRLGYGEFGGKNGGAAGEVVHVADAPGQLAGHRELAAAAAGDLTAFFTELAGPGRRGEPGRPTGCPGSRPPATRPWPPTPRCWPATRSRFIPCGSTASWPGCWTPTRW